ncbi:NAD(P)/FAD-dependent oxidoreductase [Brevundimonas balnearis]|uniref:NAD(P)/FAD-dependent oxidoreductase n=1 Tax=Brevundimonas balnearis TaxID=1572858 RepID=A0ABV6R3B2_9CAUL
MKSRKVDVLIVGAGAAGMMCAAEAGRRGRSVLVIDHARAPGEKIRISGGGRCNFTNLGCGPHAFLGENPRFAASALKRYDQHDFIALVNRHGVAWHEKTLGQLFCDDSSRQIVNLLTEEMRRAGAELRLNTSVEAVERAGDGFRATLSDGQGIEAASLVLATGGKSIPKMGATGWAYDVARRFGLRIVETRPALVPLTFEAALLERLKPLAGVAAPDAVARAGEGGRSGRFREAVLFTHRGISGPAILQISSYWREGESIELDLAPDVDVAEMLKARKREAGRQGVVTALSEHLPRRLAEAVAEAEGASGALAERPDARLAAVGAAINRWRVKPVGSEGYRTAEVTLGGVATDELDQKTMQAKTAPGLYVIGEAVDITGWLGGYNFQWAWSSGWAAGQVC